MKTLLTTILLLITITNDCMGLLYRLPKSVIPSYYNIEIVTHLNDNETKSFFFTGKVAIKVECIESTKNIVIHSKELNISLDKSKVHDISSHETHKIVKQDHEPENDFHTIYLDKPLKHNHTYEIHLEYRGHLVDGLAGYYRSSYIDNDTNKKHWLAVTQFEPTDARRAFPCFDEPSLKAKFKISLGRLKKYSSISNMPLAYTEDIKSQEGWVWDRYEETLPMSTYLVAFVVSDFGFETAVKEDSNVTFNIWARKNALEQVDFAKEVGPKALSFFEKYFDINYPLPKQDMIAVPDFSAGAMENWGLVTYREIYLLLDPNVSSAASKQRLASVVAHELAHQWFGNLVTMEWWTDLWLNEGFATYMASIAVHHMYPKWKSLTEETVSNLLQVYALDSLNSSHPVSVPIENPNEINQIFDTISYKKGSFLIHMMGNFLTTNVLRKGVSNYLNENAYSNAEQDDLWKSLTTQAHKDKTLPLNLTVKMIMDTWTLHAGYPIINVTRDYKDGTVEITQERYYKNVNKFQKNSHECWWIPLSYTTNEDFSKTEPKLWMSCPKESTVIQFSNSNHWIIFNIQASGLYRVNYDEKNWKLITADLKSSSDFNIPEINRVLLIDNAMELAWIGHLKYDVAFELLSYIKSDMDHLPWKTALEKLGSVSNMLKRTSSYGLIKSFIYNLVHPIYETLGGLTVSEEKQDSFHEVKYQILIARAACKYGVRACNKEAATLFKQWQDNPEMENIISKDMRPVIYCNAIKQGNEAEWEFLWKQYKQSNVGSEKIVILNALGCTREIWLLKRFLEWSVRNDTDVRKQDAYTVFNSVANNEVGYYVAKSFFENNIKAIHDRISPNLQRISSYVITLAKQFINDTEQKEIILFFKDNKKYFEKAQIGVRQALETVQINVQWHKNNYKIVERILKSYLEQ